MENKHLENIGLEIIAHIEQVNNRLLDAIKNKIELQKKDVSQHAIHIVDDYISKYAHRIVSLIERFLYYIRCKKVSINDHLTNLLRNYKELLNKSQASYSDIDDLNNHIQSIILLLHANILKINEKEDSKINKKYAEVIRRLLTQNTP